MVALPPIFVSVPVKEEGKEWKAKRECQGIKEFSEASSNISYLYLIG